MTRLVYNASLVAGLVLIGVGVGMVSVPWALVTVGGLVIALTLYASIMVKG